MRFTPAAWAKLLFLRDCGPSEVGGFGIAAEGDLLRVIDVQLVRQQATWASVRLDDESVADYFDRQVDAGRRPEQFARIWVHTHPGDSPLPSGIDEETFARVFGRAQWAVMFILARGGQSYARLRFNVGPGGSLTIPVRIDWSAEFAGSDHAAWQAEYQANVQVEEPRAQAPPQAKLPLLTVREAAAAIGSRWLDDEEDDWLHWEEEQQDEELWR